MSESRKPIIGISCGDLNGIGMEIIMKTFSNGEMMDLCTPVVFASSKVASYHRKALNMDHFNFHICNDFSQISDRKANLINCWNEEVNLEFGKESKEVGKFALKSLQAAVQAFKDGKIDAIVTAPIHKNSIQSEDFKFTGHTDFLESNFEGKSTMMMVSEEMRMALATVHIPLSKVTGAINTEMLTNKLVELSRSLNYDFHKKKGKIAVLALNPHAGDGGVIGDEDDKIVSPAIQAAFDKGVMAFGPFPADSFFGSNKYKQFDAILAMYHDQGLVPFKSLSFGHGVNYTAGLNVIRTSPDHGTGFDIAGKGEASESSFREAVFLACDLVKNKGDKRGNPQEPIDNKKRQERLLIVTHLRTKRFYIFAGSNDEWGEMKNLKEYDIKFSGLKLGEHSFDFQLDDKFFEHFEYSEFTRPRLKANVDLVKKENGLEVKAVVKGVVEILCDVSGEPFDLPVEGDIMLMVKYGEEYDDSNEEILILPHGEHLLNVAQYLYETTALAIPLKRVSPEVQNGEKRKEVLNKLEDLEGGEDESTDPRWDKLKDLLN